MDILSYMDKIPVCTHYLLNGKQTDSFPFPTALKNAQPVIEYFDGWKCDISHVRKWEELPVQAQEYIAFIEKWFKMFPPSEEMNIHWGFLLLFE